MLSVPAFTCALFILSIAACASAQPEWARIITGADHTDLYLPYLKGKRIGMLVNQTSIIGDKLSVDSLLALGVNVKKIFGSEHGFRGNSSNGTVVTDEDRFSCTHRSASSRERSTTEEAPTCPLPCWAIVT